MVRISELRSGEEGEYETWLASVPDSLVYYAPSFHRFLAAATGGKGSVLVARSEGEIVGALPYFEKHDPAMGTVLNSLPWYGSHGGCVVQGSTASGARSALLEAFRGAVADPGLLSATVVLSPAEEGHRPAYESVLRPVALDGRIGQITALPVEDGAPLDERLERMLAQKTRNLVRKARRQGFREVVTDDEWSWRFLHEVHAENMAAIGGLPKPLSHFEALRRYLPANMRRLSVAMLGEEPVAALLLILFNRTVEYITPVVRVQHRSRQPLSFLIWCAMQEVCRRGYRRWNWGGTWRNQDSLHHFKAGWGATDHPYTYLVTASPDRVTWLRENLSEALRAFPYFYLFPRSALTDDHA